MNETHEDIDAPSAAPSERKAIAAILAFSGAAFGFLVWLIYFHEGTQETAGATAALPAVNACLNGLSATCIVAGLIAIKTGRRRTHMTLMITAFVFSALFLISYVVYHSFQGDTKFLGEGPIRPFYFTVLISHILCTVFALPMLLTAFYFASRKRFESHKKIARIAYPLWLYVSVTGVAIFFLLRANS